MPPSAAAVDDAQQGGQRSALVGNAAMLVGCVAKVVGGEADHHDHRLQP
jgi:hypothetical protein